MCACVRVCVCVCVYMRYKFAIKFVRVLAYGSVLVCGY